MSNLFFDIVVIGAGSGGLTAAVGLAKIGKQVLLVERAELGGECTNSGCIPSKALLHHAKSYAAAIAISGENGHTENYRREAFSYVRLKIAATLATETSEHFAKLGITVLMGEAKFRSPREITVGGTRYGFKQAVIATGSSPRLVDIPGLTAADTLTNQNLFDLDDVPKRTLVIGGGPIGLEMGQAFSLLGSQVTIVDSGAPIAKLEEPSVAAVLAEAFTKQGIQFIGNASVLEVNDKVATIGIKDGGTSIHISFDKVLMAIGRTPNLPPGLDTAGVESSQEGIIVNNNYQTTNSCIYALGDVADRFKFTHQADDVARQVVARIATRGLTGIKTKSIPKVTYTDPELAQVGMSRIEAVRTYGETAVHCIEIPYSAVDRARTDNNEAGILIVIVKRLSGKILGAHIAGTRAGELIAVFGLAIDHNLSLWKLRRTMYAYPTYAGIVKKAGDYFFAREVTTARHDLWSAAKRLLPKLLLSLAWISGLVTLYSYQTNQGLTLIDTSLAVLTFITATAWGPLLYILAYTVRPITFIPGTILTVLSGVFFGLWGGIIYTIIGANLSAVFAYLIGRFFSANKRTTETSNLGRFTTALRDNPFTTVLTLRLLYLPFDAVNYTAGLLRLPLFPYILATFIGTLLGIATFVAIGASLSLDEFKANGLTADAVNSTFLILSALIFATSLLIAKLLKRYKK